MWPPLRIAVALIGLPSVLVGVACVPGLNAVVFSGHGGPGWFALALCFPLLLVNTYRLVVRPGRRAGTSPWRRSAAICLGYLVLAYPFGMLAEHRITKDSGLPMELSHSLLNLAERDGRASYPQFTAVRGIPASGPLEKIDPEPIVASFFRRR